MNVKPEGALQGAAIMQMNGLSLLSAQGLHPIRNVYCGAGGGGVVVHTMPGESSTSSVLPKSGITNTQPHSHGGVRICWSLK